MYFDCNACGHKAAIESPCRCQHSGKRIEEGHCIFYGFQVGYNCTGLRVSSARGCDSGFLRNQAGDGVNGIWRGGRNFDAVTYLTDNSRSFPVIFETVGDYQLSIDRHSWRIRPLLADCGDSAEIVVSYNDKKTTTFGGDSRVGGNLGRSSGYPRDINLILRFDELSVSNFFSDRKLFIAGFPKPVSRCLECVSEISNSNRREGGEGDGDSIKNFSDLPDRDKSYVTGGAFFVFGLGILLAIFRICRNPS